MTIAQVVDKYKGKLTQEEFEQLTGISQTQLSMVLNGKRNPGTIFQRKFIRAFPHAVAEFNAALVADVLAETSPEAVPA